MKHTLRTLTALLVVCAFASIGMLNWGAPSPVAQANAPLAITPEPEPRPGGGGGGGSQPFIITSLVPTPRVFATAGSTVDMVATVRNLDTGRAKDVTVTMPLDPNVMSVVDVQFERTDDGAGVISSTPTELVFTPGEVAGETERTVTIRVQLSDSLAEGTPLGMRLNTEGSGTESGRRIGNLPQLRLGSANQDATVDSMTASPVSGPAGSTHTFTANTFHPNEPVTLWYHTASGEDVEVGTVSADAEGVVSVLFTTTGLAAGDYTMVGNGNWSQLQAVAPFTVE